MIRPVAAKKLGNKLETAEPSRVKNAGDAQINSAGSSASSYTPAVGDVVEFEESDGEISRAIIYGDGTYLAYEFGLKDRVSSGKILKVLGHTEIMHNIVEFEVAEAIAKAYFAKEQEPEYKVGDLVEVVDDATTQADIGQVGVVDRCNNDYITVKLQLNGHLALQSLRPCHIRPISGTYKERQAKFVEFYELKVRSKVKIVSMPVNGENGWTSTYHPKNDSNVGVIAKVGAIYDRGLSLHIETANGGLSGSEYPYFVLEPVKD